MTHWIEETPVAVCPSCGADCSPDRPAFIDLTWTDDDECEAGYLAVALMAHRFAAHRVEVSEGDLVRYWSPWRGLILGSEVYKVDGSYPSDQKEFARSMGAEVEPLLGTSYRLIDPNRPRDAGKWCWPFVGDPERPIVFELVQEAPPVELDLLDMLDDWDTNHENRSGA